VPSLRIRPIISCSQVSEHRHLTLQAQEHPCFSIVYNIFILPLFIPAVCLALGSILCSQDSERWLQTFRAKKTPRVSIVHNIFYDILWKGVRFKLWAFSTLLTYILQLRSLWQLITTFTANARDLCSTCNELNSVPKLVIVRSFSSEFLSTLRILRQSLLKLIFEIKQLWCSNTYEKGLSILYWPHLFFFLM